MIVTGQLLAFVMNSIVKSFNGAPRLDIASDPTGTLSAGTHSFDDVNALMSSQGGTMDTSQWYTYISNLVVSGGNGHAWRIMLLICTIPAIALWLGMRLMPESPRWYAKNLRFYDAIGSLQRVRVEERDGSIAGEMQEMIANEEVREAREKGTFKDIMSTPWMRKLFSVFVTLGVIAALFEFTIAPVLASGEKPVAWAPMVILVMMGIFMLVVQAGNGPVVWTMLGEMFPQKVRGIANGAAVFCMWIVNAIITVAFPPMMANLGGGITYGIFAVVNLVFGFVLIKIMPETSNKSLEEIEAYVEKRYS